ncbi:MAG: discoidin domain-containing protein [Acidobacteriota bacterium]
MRCWRRPLAALALFVALALLMTYPLALRLGSSVTDRGDPLLNTWILAWDVKQILDGNASTFFEANIFYPHARTLAYSEHLFPQASLALPVLVLSGNPILAYNFVLLVAFVFSGFGMYLLARHLTGSTAGAVVAGVIFAFSPFMFSHLAHMQVIFAGGIPLTFLFLERFFAGERWRDLGLFAFFFTVQILANGYYALFLSFFVACFVAYRGVSRRGHRGLRLTGKLALAGLAIAAVSGPFFYQYLTFRRETGFVRSAHPGAQLTSFLAASGRNRLYGELTAPIRRSERELFPGALALVLAGLGLYACRRRQPLDERGQVVSNAIDRPLAAITWRRVLNAGMLVCAAGAVAVLAAGQRDWLIKLRPNGALWLVTTIGTLYLVKEALAAAQNRKRADLLAWREPLARFYWLVLVLAFLFTFGNDGPYSLLHNYVPGFDGLRAITRWHVFVMLPVALFSGFGMRAVLARRRKLGRIILSVAAPLVLLVEYACIPLRLDAMPVGAEIPAVYRWLAEHAGAKDPVLELPLPAGDEPSWRVECPRVYFSTYHFRPIVNGFSGFPAPVHSELRRRVVTQSLAETASDVRELGVRYLVVHHEGWRPGKLEALITAARSLPDELKLLRSDSESDLFELIYAPNTAHSRPEAATGPLLPKTRWRVGASVRNDRAPLAIDGDMATRWDTGPQRRGMRFFLDLGQQAEITGIRLRLGGSVRDYPRGCQLEMSADGTSWRVVAQDPRAELPITAYLRPTDLAYELSFPPARGRYLRLTNLNDDKVFYWSIHEIEVVGEAAGRP